MGKRIIQQARGHGSLTYRVRRRAYRFRIGYPDFNTEGKAKVQNRVPLLRKNDLKSDLKIAVTISSLI